MDAVLNVVDPMFFDAAYEKVGLGFLDRSDFIRQYISVFIIWWTGGTLSYLIFSGLSYIFLFDMEARKDKRFLPNQEWLEMGVSLKSIPIMAIPSCLIFVAEVRGYSKLYDGVEGTIGWAYIIFSVILYLIFTDTLIYWIHKWQHHPILYAPIHKLHHKWLITTPFASYAFHPVDGFSQSMPYHIFAFMFPLNKILYMGLFMFVCMWTISIHDGKGFYMGKIINGADHHTIHHKQFNYNYGQYFTFWDRVMDTHREPIYDKTKQSE